VGAPRASEQTSGAVPASVLTLSTPMTKNRSPHQTFGRSTFKVRWGDPELRGREVVVVRPSKERQPFATNGNLKPEGPGPLPEGFLDAPDIEGLPWVRSRGNEWTEPEFRRWVREWLAKFMRVRSHQHRWAGWKVEERANADRMSVSRLPDHLHYLRITVIRREGQERVFATVALDFPPWARGSRAAAMDRLRLAAEALDAEL
jgi:hypothetical protein